MNSATKKPQEWKPAPAAEVKEVEGDEENVEDLVPDARNTSRTQSSYSVVLRRETDQRTQGESGTVAAKEAENSLI